MAMRNLTVTFHTNVYSKNWKGFQFPEPLARLLGRKKGKRLNVGFDDCEAHRRSGLFTTSLRLPLELK
jgi:hypothetical protein